MSLQISHDLVRGHEAIRIVALIFTQLSFSSRGLRGEFKLICGPLCRTAAYFSRRILTAYWVPAEAVDRGYVENDAAPFPKNG